MKTGRFARLLSLVLAAALFLSAAPALAVEARAANAGTTVSHMERLRELGILRGDEAGNLNPNQPITRAELATMVNRAYGYDKLGPIPFRDVSLNNWYYQDIAIAYNAGYFQGLDAYTAGPMGKVTREQALVFLARNLRMTPSVGEVTQFVDGHSFNYWSRDYVKEAVNSGIITGFEDGSFRPQNYITRGDFATMLSRALGELVQEPGRHEKGEVLGNLTISSSDTTLANTTIMGNLYISGGLGLGGVTLDNVKVLGDIVVAGAGESEAGSDSVVLRNTEASGLVVDNIAGQYMSVRTEGYSKISDATIRTGAYIQDRCPSGQGLLNIVLDGTGGQTYNLTGNLKTVTDYTPNSTVNIAAGTLQTLNIDEEAAGTTVDIGINSTVYEINLDTGVPITGYGDIEKLVVNTPGTTTAMLPDKIEIRPGVTANIHGETMDTKLAQEASSNPYMLARYPRINDLAPTSATAVFSANKKGTIHWAVTSVTDGSVSENDLLNPAQNKLVLKSGTLNAGLSNTEYTAKISGLTSGGSYYLSAVMVDARGTRSPVKVISFVTPDNSTPNFVNGYPKVEFLTKTDSEGNPSLLVQASVMSTKTCDMYYALFPKGSDAPTAQELKSGAVSGSWGYGKLSVNRNEARDFVPNDAFRVMSAYEQEQFDLYVWLTDSDGGKSSAVKKVTFTIPDLTPPEFVTFPAVKGGSAKPTSVGVTATLNEKCTLYWVAVSSGTVYPRQKNGSLQDPEPLNSDYAILQVSSGLFAEKSGKVNANANAEVTVNISGLKAEKAYDVYFVAKDAAGNYSRAVHKLTVNTLDTTAPTAELSFNRYEGKNSSKPYANTDVTITFSENVVQASTGKKLVELYNAVKLAENDADRADAKNQLASALRKTIILKNYTGTVNAPAVPERRTDEQEDWVIDYRNAVIRFNSAGKLEVVFYSEVDADMELQGYEPALNLKTGSSYYFQLEDLADTVLEPKPNQMDPMTILPETPPYFTTISALVAITTASQTDLNLYEENQQLDTNGKPVFKDDNGNPISVSTEGNKHAVKDTTATNGLTAEQAETMNAIDACFNLTPVSTSKADPNDLYDIIIWSDLTVEFEVYRRVITDEDKNPGWTKLEQDAKIIVDSSDTGYVGHSFHARTGGLDPKQSFPKIVENLKDDGTVYQYAVHIVSHAENTDRKTWNKNVNFRVSVISGTNNSLQTLTIAHNAITEPNFKASLTWQDPVRDISSPDDYRVTAPFTDQRAPEFTNGFPTFTATDSSIEMSVMLNRPGTVYWVAAPVDAIVPQDGNKDNILFDNDQIPHMGYLLKNGVKEENPSLVIGPDENPTAATWNDIFKVASPTLSQIHTPTSYRGNSKIKTGNITVGEMSSFPIMITGLTKSTEYFIYIVLKGTSAVYSDAVLLYKVKTPAVSRPVITLDADNPDVYVSSDRDAIVDYLVVKYTANDLNPLLKEPMVTKKGSGDTAKYTSNVIEIKDTPTPEEIKELEALYNRGTAANPFTVLNAMATAAPKDGEKASESLFDRYASDSYKDRVANFIRNTSSDTSGQIIGSDRNLNVPKDKRVKVECSKLDMAYLAQYAFLAVGESSQGSADAFRAYYPLEKIDKEAPYVTDVSVTSQVYEFNPGTYFADCNVTLTFNEPIYYADTTTSPRVMHPLDKGVVDKSSLNPTPEQELFIAFAKYGTIVTDKEPGLMPWATVDVEEIKKDADFQTVNSIKISFRGATNGASIQFTPNLSDAKENIKGIPLVVTIKLETPKGAAAGTPPEVSVVVRSEWLKP